MKKYLSIALLGGALALAGCGDSDENFVFTNNNVQNLVAPSCVDDAYNASSNQTLTVAAANGVLANDAPAQLTALFPTTSAQGGTIVGNADGSFTYTPANNFVGTDTFTYTASNALGQAQCTVTITVAAVNGFFVDAANGNDGTGSFTNGVPFATIQAAVTQAGANQDIVVRPGTYNEDVTLLDGQRLLGSGSSLINPQGVVRPVINGGGITLADGNTVDFIRIQNTPGDAIFGNGVNGATITNCEMADTTNVGSGIEDQQATGSWRIENNLITGVDSIGVFLTGDTGEQLEVVIVANAITNSENGAVSIVYAQSGEAVVQVVNNIMTGTTTPGRTFEAIAADTANLCFDITGNTNDDTYSFARADDTAVIEVEQLSMLLTLNSSAATLTNPPGGGSFPATEVADGACGF